jgi:hypothetical protein
MAPRSVQGAKTALVGASLLPELVNPFAQIFICSSPTAPDVSCHCPQICLFVIRNLLSIVFCQPCGSLYAGDADWLSPTRPVARLLGTSKSKLLRLQLDVPSDRNLSGRAQAAPEWWRSASLLGAGLFLSLRQMWTGPIRNGCVFLKGLVNTTTETAVCRLAFWGEESDPLLRSFGRAGFRATFHDSVSL